jgi:hypothetical protein
MAFWEWPKVHGVSSHEIGLGHADIPFNWGKMLSADKGVDPDNEIGKLMVHIGVHAKSEYAYGSLDKNNNLKKKDPAGTSTYNINQRIALRDMGYKDPGNFAAYKFSGVKSSINKGKPVIVAGYSEIKFYFLWIPIYGAGHSWVIDGYRRMSILIKDNATGKPVSDGNYIDYVHCNLGWAGDKNGWYFTGIFETNKIELDKTLNDNVPKRSSIDGYYQYGIKMLTDITPNR